MSQVTEESDVQSAEAASRRVAWRVVFPEKSRISGIPLYVDGDQAGTSHDAVGVDDLISRRSVRVKAGKWVSFGSYFNAFPAGYWNRWTVVDSVRLRVKTSGKGSVLVFKSNARASQQQVDVRQVDGSVVSEFDLSLTSFGDGGFYWFDMVAGDKDFVLEEADWSIPDMGRPRKTVSLGVTTFNRPDFCTETIGMVAEDKQLREILDEMIIVDQGNQKVCDDPNFPVVAAAMGDQLRIVDQDNLGGSGGFSRCMYEAVTKERSEYVILLDDDIMMETESVARLVTFADYTRKPTMVGGHMFDINNLPKLHTFGEIVNPFYWQPGLPGDDQEMGHDFAEESLRETEWMHQRVDVDYNGWWMCLIPVSVIKELGLSLPIFIKWDDVEYGLRGKERGISTVSLPGAAVWHVTWADKDDLVGWQAYFHARNRMMTAIMYSAFQPAMSVIRTAYMLDLKHLVAMQYYTGTGRIMGIQDVLAGPRQLHSILGKRLGEIRAMASEFDDSRIAQDLDQFPEIKRRSPLRPRRVEQDNIFGLMKEGAMAVARQMFKPVDDMAMEHPQQRIAHKDNAWYRVARNDSVLVSTADGSGVSWYRRDPRMMRKLAAQTSSLHQQIMVNWTDLRKQYRDARDEITSFEQWEKTFGIK